MVAVAEIDGTELVADELAEAVSCALTKVVVEASNAARAMQMDQALVRIILCCVLLCCLGDVDVYEQLLVDGTMSVRGILVILLMMVDKTVGRWIESLS